SPSGNGQAGSAYAPPREARCKNRRTKAASKPPTQGYPHAARGRRTRGDNRVKATQGLPHSILLSPRRCTATLAAIGPPDAQTAPLAATTPASWWSTWSTGTISNGERREPGEARRHRTPSQRVRGGDA